jgi:hypothetical protein
MQDTFLEHLVNVKVGAELLGWKPSSPRRARSRLQAVNTAGASPLRPNAVDTDARLVPRGIPLAIAGGPGRTGNRDSNFQLSAQ